MSALAAAPLRRPQERRPQERRPQERHAPTRHLEIAPSRAQRRARPRVVYAVVIVSGIGVILLAQLLMSILLAGGAYRISDLQLSQRDLSRQEHALTEDLQTRSSTQNLAANAEALGMVASGNPVFLDLATGQVSGTGTAAGGSLIGSQGNLIGNSLLDPTMVIDPHAAVATSAAPGASGKTPSTVAVVPVTQVTPGGTLPSPTTH